MSPQQLRGRSWRRIAPRTYIRAGLPDSPTHLLAGVQSRLPNAVFAGRTAAWLHGLEVAACDPIEVNVQPGCGLSARVGVTIRRTQLEEGEIVVRRGMRVTSIQRTLADVASRLSLVEAVVVADIALHRRLIELTALRIYVESRAGRFGVTNLRRVLELAEPAAESPMETRLRLLLQLGGLPRPQAQVPLLDAGGRFLGRADLYYPAQRLLVEYDGGGHRDRLVADNRRQNRLLAAGFRILRFTAADVLGNPESVVAQVSAALRSG